MAYTLNFELESDFKFDRKFDIKSNLTFDLKFDLNSKQLDLPDSV